MTDHEDIVKFREAEDRLVAFMSAHAERVAAYPSAAREAGARIHMIQATDGEYVLHADDLSLILIYLEELREAVRDLLELHNG